MSHDVASGRWTFIRVTHPEEGKVAEKRITATCSSYQWGHRDPVTGPNACGLLVGRYIQDRYSLKQNEAQLGHLYIFEDPNMDILTIMEGDGDDRVSQQFKVIESRVLEPQR